MTSAPQWEMLDSDSYTFFQLKEEHEKATIHSNDGNDIIINKYFGKNPIVFCDNCNKKKFGWEGYTREVDGFIVFCRGEKGRGVKRTTCSNYTNHPLCKSLGDYTNGRERGKFVGYTVYELDKKTNTYWMRTNKFNKVNHGDEIISKVTTPALDYVKPKGRVHGAVVCEWQGDELCREDSNPFTFDGTLTDLFTTEEELNILNVLTIFKSIVEILSDWVESAILLHDPPCIKLIEGVNLDRFMRKFSGINKKSISVIKEQLNNFKQNVIPFIYMKNGLKYKEGQDGTNLTIPERKDLMEKVIKPKVNEICRVLNEIIDQEIANIDLGAIKKKKPSKKKKLSKKKKQRKKKKPSKKKKNPRNKKRIRTRRK